jgi:predicted  nucleic acid-binding Zn-ribbon protein
MNEDFKDVSDEIKAIDRSIELRQQHLSKADIYKQNKPIYDKYKKTDPKQAEAFYDKHFEAIQDYEAARDYLKAVMGEHTTIPVKMWEKQLSALTDKRARLCERFYGLKDDLKNAETIIRGAENIIGEEAREAPERKQSIER